MPSFAHPMDDLGEQTWSALVHLAQALHLKNAELAPTLAAVVAHAVQTIEPAAHAGLILLVRGELVPQATEGAPPEILDALQQQTGSGPCIDAAREQSVITVEDTTMCERWPEFSQRAAELNVFSMLCVPLSVDELQLGALSLYGQKPDAFGPHDRALTDLYAAHAAIALADAQRTAQLREALVNRDVIGQAKGILMERMKITSPNAFEQLAQASQRTNRKLRAIAQQLVDTGELP
jgi:GAF domain-containing protein